MSQYIEQGTTLPKTHSRIRPDNSIYGYKAIVRSRLQHQKRSVSKNECKDSQPIDLESVPFGRKLHFGICEYRCRCLYIYMYIYICVDRYTCNFYTYISIDIHMNAFVYINVYLNLFTYIICRNIYLYICIYKYLYIYIYVYIYIYIYIYICTNIYTYIYIYI